MATNTKAIRDRSDDELVADVKQLREQLFKLRWQASHGQLDNPNKIRAVRRDIARHLTVASERSRGKAAAPAESGAAS